MDSPLRNARWPLALIVLLSLIAGSLACDININLSTTAPPSDAGDPGDAGDAGDAVDPGDAGDMGPPSPPTCDSLTFDPAILGVGVVTEVVAEVPPGGMPPGSPEHMRYNLTGYPVGLSMFEAYMELFSVAAYISGSPYAADNRDTLRQVLDTRPATPTGRIWIPSVFNAGEIMSTSFEYLEFHNGSGVRYLTQYGQAYMEVSNESLFYTFQGLTHGDECWVSVIFPVNHISLPDTSGVPGGDPEAYYAGVAAALDAEHPDSFSPSLLLLDELIRSIEVE